MIVYRKPTHRSTSQLY